MVRIYACARLHAHTTVPAHQALCLPIDASPRACITDVIDAFIPGTELIAGRIDTAKTFTPDPATCSQEGENSAAGQVRTKETLAEGAAAVVQRVKLVAADIKRTSAKLDLVLAVLDTGEYEAHNEDVRDEEGNVI